MKILIVQLGWSGHGVGGGDKHLLEASESWQTKHKVTLLLPRNGRRFLEGKLGFNLSPADLWTVWEVFPFDFLNNLASILLSYAQRLFLGPIQVLWFGRRFDLVISSSHFLYDLLLAVILKIFRRTKAVVYVFHLVGDQKRSKGLQSLISVFAERLSLWLVKRYFDSVMVDNASVQARLGQWGIDPSKVKVVPVGIRRPPNFEGLVKKLDLCFLGRLVESKGILDLVNVLKILRRRGLNARLAIVGTGSLEVRLKKSFEREGLLGLVYFAGEVDEEKKYRLLRESKVFVSPSYEEGWGIALGEAFSCGLPAVVYDLPVLREVFGDGPVFVPLGDKPSLADQIAKLLSDDEFYHLKSKAGRRCVDDYYLDLVLPRELSLLESL